MKEPVYEVDERPDLRHTVVGPPAHIPRVESRVTNQVRIQVRFGVKFR